MNDRGDGRIRFVFIDQARALAIFLMLVGHSLDRFLGEPWRSSAAYDHYIFVRGLSSALFLTVSGFSFVIASFSRMADYRSFSNRMMGRMRRISLILFLGMLLHLPGNTLLESLAQTDQVVWERFFGFNVLETIGVGLLLLHGLLYCAPKPAHFAWLAFAMMISVFPYGFALPHMASNTFARAGCAPLAVSLLYLLSLRALLLARFSQIISKDALAIYFVHLLLVYGSAIGVGLFPSYAIAMTPGQVVLFIVGLIVAMISMALMFGYFRDHHQKWFTRTRRIAILGVILSFVLLPNLYAVGVAMCCVASVFVFFAALRCQVSFLGKFMSRMVSES